jgi:hypothetical protein
MTDKHAVDLATELARIAAAHDGILNPADVVAAATPPDHPLHGMFEWDNRAAATEYRLWQARELIASVRVLPAPDAEPVRAYVSLQQDRHGEGGYRPLAGVLRDDDLRAAMLAEALADLQRIRTRYRMLSELAGVWAAMSRVEQHRAAKQIVAAN